MWTYHPELLDRQVPRYTSYPTAVEFHDGVGALELERALDGLAEDAEISLYAHIPYCQQICHYCGCYTAAANKASRLTSYLEALESDILLIGHKLGRKGRIRHIAFGGGSPNAIKPLEFIRLVDRMVTSFTLDAPAISVELDPRILTREWASILGQCGVTRASLGVQSFSPDIQKAIGRVQPYAQVAGAVDMLRQNGVHAINFDLVYGLPGQGIADLEDTLRKTLELGPSRVALFGYAHLPNVIPRQRQIDGSTLADAEPRFIMAAVGYQALADAGYRAIRFDHFARPDDPLAIAAEQGRVRRNFQGFTEDQCTALIGMGASAISCFPDLIVQNEKNMGRYGMMLSQAKLPIVRGIARTGEDQLRSQLIENLLCTGDTGPIPLHILATAKGDASEYFEKGLAYWDDGAIKLEAGGLPYARVVASIFDRYRQISPASFSNAI